MIDSLKTTLTDAAETTFLSKIISLVDDLEKKCCRRSVFQRLFLTLSSRKAKKPASPTVTNSRKAKIRACIYSRKAEISALKFRKKTVKHNVGSGRSGSGDPMLWELRVRGLSFHWCPLVIPVMSSLTNVSNVINDNP